MNDAELAIALVLQGARVARRCFERPLARIPKGGGDFATDADVEAEQAMLTLLHAERPNDSMKAEESGERRATNVDRVWLIDPLCGTLNYAAGMRVAGVNVALREGAHVTVGAVADAFGGEVFWTDGNRAYRRMSDVDTCLTPDASSTLVDLNFDPPFPSAPHFQTVTLAAHGEFTSRFRPRVVSTSLALAWVATGQRAAYVTDGDVRDSVHFAAGIAVCEAAGCVVSNLRGGPWGDGATGLIAAADRDTHRAIVDIASAMVAETGSEPSADP